MTPRTSIWRLAARGGAAMFTAVALVTGDARRSERSTGLRHWPADGVKPVPPEYSIGRLTCRYWLPAWRCGGWLAGCP
jgi:hypothetical protein